MNWNEALYRIQKNPQLLQQLAKSSDGQALMDRLQRNGQSLEQATQSGQNGDYIAMSKLLREVMTDRDGRALLERLAKQLK